MKGRVIVRDRLDGRKAAALLEDGRLEDLLIDPPDGLDTAPEAVLCGVAGRPMKGQGGIFVELPQGRGFLRQAKGIRPGSKLMVQVSGYGDAAKALPLTTRVLLKGRHAIATPGAPGCNIARSIRDRETRAALQALADAEMAGAPADMGLILRSSAADAPEPEIRADIAAMRDLALSLIDRCAATADAPALLDAAPDAHSRAARDWADPQTAMPAPQQDGFAAHGVLELIAQLRSPQHSLPTGGSMVLEQTSALVAVDVNTGNDTSPAAGLKVNLAAARALPRALRLRGLGGQIAVDFAPMPRKDRQALEQALEAACRRDTSEITLAGWTPLGNFELHRKRDRLALHRLLPG